MRTNLPWTMPPSNRGGLGEEAYLQLAAFILEANGVAYPDDTSPTIGHVSARS